MARKQAKRRATRHAAAAPAYTARRHQNRKGKASVKSAEQVARRDAILQAALRVFAEHGFEAARLDDVAARAGVAKGTLYLYFRDKTALFEEIIRNAASPLIARFETMSEVPDVPTPILLEGLFMTFVKEVLGTERKLVLRLVIAEGPRFPAIAKFYHEEIVSRGLRLISRIIARGVARGEIASGHLAEFPQLVMAPLLVAVIWDGLFQKQAPLDLQALLKAHLTTIVGTGQRTSNTSAPTGSPAP